MDTISPFIRTPFSDITGGIHSHQVPGMYCQKMELQMAECIEAYGLDRGLKKCRCMIEDFKECHSKTKQYLRFMAMRAERDRQIAAGELKGKNKYVTPRIDSY